MTDTIRYIKGIKSSVVNEALIKQLSVEEMVALLQNTSEYYEVMSDKNTHTRLYLDIDTNPPNHISNEDFDELDKKIKQRILEKFDGQRIALATSTGRGKDNKPKISWRVYFPDLMTDRETNKAYANQLKHMFDGIPDTKIDTSCYAKNQKMRMVNQNKNEKEGDFRPLRLVQGEIADTLITYIPEGIERFVLPDVKEETKKKREMTKKLKADEQEKEKERDQIIKANQSLFNYLNMLTSARIDDYDSWIKIGFILFDKGIPVDAWVELSRRGSKFNEGECEKKWESFRKRGDDEEKVGVSTILKWIEEDTPELFEKTYVGQKKKFEETHFKTMYPSGFHRVFTHGDGRVELQKFISLNEMYCNLFVENGESFVGRWVKDPTIRTYQAFGFYPNRSLCPANEYNLFTGFEVEKMEITDPTVNFNRIMVHINTLVGNNQEYFDYFIRYLAHIFQYPEIKAGVAIIFNGAHGTGKDMFLGFIERLLGYGNYVSTGSPEEVIFSRFNAVTACKLLIHVEEMSKNLFRKYSEKVKTRITKEAEHFEEKGEKAIYLPCYERYIFTTNDEIPIYLEPGERRIVIFTPSSENCKNFAYFDALAKDMKNPSICRMFYNYLKNLDLSNWDIEKKLNTKTYDDLLAVSATPLARMFNDMCIEDRELDEIFTTETLIEKVRCPYPLTPILLGREIVEFRKVGAVGLIRRRDGVRYKINKEKMIDYLKLKKWWYDPRDVVCDGDINE